MNVASLIAEYFVDLRADSLSMHTHENILTFLLDLAEEKEYRCYMVNKALFVYLNECFCNKASSKRLKSQISEVDCIANQACSHRGICSQPERS